MALPIEAIETVLRFHPKMGTSGQRLDLGEIDEGVTLVHDVFLYQLRVETIPGQPYVDKWTRQPVLALVEGGRVNTLAYADDVIGLPERLAKSVVDRLHYYSLVPTR